MPLPTCTMTANREYSASEPLGPSTADVAPTCPAPCAACPGVDVHDRPQNAKVVVDVNNSAVPAASVACPKLLTAAMKLLHVLN